ncbi:MAG TPA: glycosyltransferase family 39 protein [Xanthomonadales bacterium]|nr:glycosyltransferase family 39 protein [Xanthomonadales bacterium]
MWLLAATAVAAILRLTELGEWSLWVDEAHSWRDATQPLAGFAGSNRVYYPVTFLLLRGLLHLGVIGQSEWSLRLPFAVIGIATVPLLGVCGRKIVGATPAVLSAWFLAIDPFHVFWSQNARGYAIVVFTAVIAIERTFAYAREPRTRDMIAVVLAIAFGAMAHATAGLLAVSLVAFFVLRPMKRIGLRTVFVLVALAAVVAVVLDKVANNFFSEFLASKDKPSLRHFVQTTGFYFRPVALLVAAVGLWMLRWIGGRDRALLLGTFGIVPFLVLLVVGDQVVLVTARYAICTLPVISWLAAFACVRAGEAIRGAVGVPLLARVAACAVLPLLVAGDYGSQLVPYYGAQHGQRGRWREAAELLKERAGKAPIRVLTVNQRTLEYYLRPGHWANKVPPAYARNDVMPIEDWMIEKGLDESRVNKVHEPGAAAHIAWHLAQARSKGALFAVVVTWPELVEKDQDSSLRHELSQSFVLAQYFPCWVGPKDESIHVFLPKEL